MFIARKLLSKPGKIILNSPIKTNARLLSGSSHNKSHDHSHDHHHEEHKHGPYDPPHEKFDENNAYFLGIGPDYKYQGWEGFSLFVVLTCAAMFIIIPQVLPHENHRAWARREALAREKAKAKGIEIEYGKYYSEIKEEEEEEAEETQNDIFSTLNKVLK